ncbi:OadG family protein [Shewanella marisflavi]|uniref:Probable oxaloacetate decarboxylase gamma chain n=1 Tax=Shewanella marisflavi TaxID=260364 RepID=A0AAC9U2T5_9GAMM|nr:OadG family transporter subunit [Shewanella marisflavi]ASJ97471.1 sodium pump decarboxylase subunit gamma [Shewanella marisflavi]MCL1040740.1 OadG family protein [Shewanella marisflavi]
MDSMAQQIMEALMIMGLGMGLVFIFLTILIGVVKLVAWKFAPEAHVPPVSDASDEGVPHFTGVDPKMVAVISAAIHQYRAKA